MAWDKTETERQREGPERREQLMRSTSRLVNTGGGLKGQQTAGAVHNSLGHGCIKDQWLTRLQPRNQPAPPLPPRVMGSGEKSQTRTRAHMSTFRARFMLMLKNTCEIIDHQDLLSCYVLQFENVRHIKSMGEHWK